MTTYCRDGSPRQPSSPASQGGACSTTDASASKASVDGSLRRFTEDRCERTGQSSPRRLARSPPAGISIGAAAKRYFYLYNWFINVLHYERERAPLRVTS